jgi:Tol biopolymer transport system component
MNEWIKCTDRQPEKDGRYLVFEKYPTGHWIGVSGLRSSKWDSATTKYWMELPDNPEIEK